MVKCYIIKNIKSGYFYTNQGHFEELGSNTKLYKSYRDAYKQLEGAKNNQAWDVLESVYDTDRWHIDIGMDEYGNVLEYIELCIRGLYMAEGDAS